MRAGSVLVVVVISLSGCGGSSPAASPSRATTTSTTPTHELTVRYIAGTGGMTGCYNSPVLTGNQLIVKDQKGAVLGTGTFALSAGADSCDWTGTVEDIPEMPFYEIYSDGTSLQTVPLSDMQQDDWDIKMLVG